MQHTAKPGKQNQSKLKKSKNSLTQLSQQSNIMNINRLPIVLHVADFALSIMFQREIYIDVYQNVGK